MVRSIEEERVYGDFGEKLEIYAAQRFRVLSGGGGQARVQRRGQDEPGDRVRAGQ